MKHRHLGASSVNVSEVALGARAAEFELTDDETRRINEHLEALKLDL
jgi:hypothetical protein